MNVTVIGAGYVGLVTGVGLASVGHQVNCVDIDADRVAMIQRGEVPFYERDLPEMLQKVLSEGRFSATTDVESAILRSAITFIAVGTPTINGQQDLSAIKTATHTIGRILQQSDQYHTIVVKSTVLPKTSREVVYPILLEYLSKGQFGVCMNPEFLREGTAVNDFMQPDRIVIGGSDKRCVQMLTELYAPFQARIWYGSLEEVELVKYTSNALLATLISFSNEIGALCEATPNTDVRNVMQMLHMDQRLTPLIDNHYVSPEILTYLQSSFGYGGSCLPKDARALRAYGQSLDIPMHMMESVIQVNDERPNVMIRLAEHHLGDLRDKIITVLGLAFKNGTDDTRESPSLAVIDRLLVKGALVRGYDPRVKAIDYPEVSLFDTSENAIVGSDAVMICVNHYEFVRIKWSELAPKMRNPLLIDGRRLVLDVDKPMSANLTYVQIGKMPSQADD